MNILIIYTHPNRESLNNAFLENVLAATKDNQNINEVKILDLYQDNFNPALIFNNEKKRRYMHQDPAMEIHRNQILWADKLVFIYPIWWGRPPAMLLGYIDRLFTANFAYKYTGKIMPKGLLKDKSVVCISTMKGPTGYPLLTLNNAHKVLMKRGLFSFVGIKKVKFFEFGQVESNKNRNERNLNKVYNYFKTIRV